MKKLKFLLIFPFLTLFAQGPTNSVSPTKYFEAKGTADKQKTVEGEAAAAKAEMSKEGGGTGGNEMMLIPSAMRAKDLQEAFGYLRQMTPSGKIGMELQDGSVITEILDLKVMSEGTMIIFKINSVQGVKFRAVKVEEIKRLTNG
ncbi:MAG: hypothetical protein HYZ47_01440 [Simkania negevensis]|nr:hypothetical protein [Simkania negevensis]